MALRRIKLPGCDFPLSVLMGAPSSANFETHAKGLEAFRQLGGNCIHLHGEGGETHSRQFVGDWLRKSNTDSPFYVCTQICHDQWDAVNGRSIMRFSSDAVHEDVAMDLLLTDLGQINMVYLDDRPTMPFEPVFDALHEEWAAGRIQGIGVRNWTPDRILAAHSYCLSRGKPTLEALFTTELALLSASVPLWPGYVPFDSTLRRLVSDLNLCVFAHATDATLGQCLYGNEDASARLRPQWITRWNVPRNTAVLSNVQTAAALHGVSERVVNFGWLLNQPFSVIAIVSLTDVIGIKREELLLAASLSLSAAEANSLAFSSCE